MVEDLGIEAKESAVREVAKLLPLPELLLSISSIKADYIARQQVHLNAFFCKFPIFILITPRKKEYQTHLLFFTFSQIQM